MTKNEVHPLHQVYLSRMTQEEALEHLYSQKGPSFWKSGRKEVFLWADLVEEVVIEENGKTISRIPAGKTVLVTVASRFGDVGIRSYQIRKEAYGYEARVMPEALTNWRVQNSRSPR